MGELLIRTQIEGAADRSPPLVFTPNVRTDAKLPLLLLLHGRCQGALGADSYFHFANAVDEARARACCRACCRAWHAPRPCDALGSALHAHAPRGARPPPPRPRAW